MFQSTHRDVFPLHCLEGPVSVIQGTINGELFARSVGADAKQSDEGEGTKGQ